MISNIKTTGLTTYRSDLASNVTSSGLWHRTWFLKSCKHVVIMICLLVLAPALLAWNESWESIRQTAATISTLSASFTQEKHLPLLKKPLQSTGSMIYAKPDSLRWEYQSPIASILLSQRGETSRYVKQAGSFVKDAGAQVQAMQIVLDEITQWLGGNFENGKNFTARLEPNGLILLTPKDDQLAKLIDRIEVHLSEKAGLIDAVMIFESRQSYTKLVFKEVILNGAIAPLRFQKP